MRTGRYAAAVLVAALLSVFIFGCSNSDSGGGGGGGSLDTLDPAWTACNDCAVSGTPVNPNTTAYGFDTVIPGWGSTGGPLKMISDGTSTPVSVAVDGQNLRTWDPSGTPDPGTDAYEMFNGLADLDEIVSYGNTDPPYEDWYFSATFTGLDPSKRYAFVTTANRNNSDYGADSSTPRWTLFTISGADTYANISSSGATAVSESATKMNTGYNTDNGYVAAWTDITAADGSFTVTSENVGPEGPGDEYRSYGMQGFLFMELAD